MPPPPSERGLHPASFLFELGSHARQLLLPGALVLIAGARGAEMWQVYGMLLIVPVALVAIARALVFRYTLTEHELVLRSGLLVRQQRHVPYARIQNIDALQTVVHRALAVVEVRLETAGGEEPEAHLKVLSVPAYEEMRVRVQAARGAAAGPAPADVAAAGDRADARQDRAAVELLKLSTRDLVVCGLIQGRGLIVIGALFGLLWELGLADRLASSWFGEEVAGRGVLRQLARAIGGDGIPPRKIVLTAGALVAFVILARVFSVVWALVRLHRFTLRRTGDDLRADFGLFTRVAATIPIRRIQTVTVEEGPVHRLFGRVSVRVATAGGESGESEGLGRQWLAPVVQVSALAPLMQQVLPDVAFPPAAWNPVDPRGVRRARAGWIVFAALAALLAAPVLHWWTLLVLAAVVAAGELDARRSVAALGWGLVQDGIAFRSGWIWRRQTVAPYAKIQTVALRESPFDRRYAMARVDVDTAGASAARHRIDVPYLARPAAARLATELAARASETTFRW